MDDHDSPLSEEEAQRIWRRAAELQANAAERLEARSRALLEEDDETGDGYAIVHVRQAAVEAGISPEFIDAALAESAGGEARLGPIERNFSAALVGPLPSHLQVSQVISAPPEDVYRVLQRMLPSPPYHLSLLNIQGSHPLEGGTMVFEVPKLGSEGPHKQVSAFVSDLRGWANISSLTIGLRPIGEGGRRCEVTVSASLGTLRKANLWFGGAMVTSAAVWGAWAAVGAFGVVGLVAAPIVWAGGSRVWRALAPWGVGRGRRAMERLLQALAGHVQTGGAFSGGALGFPEIPPTQSGPDSTS